MMNAALRFLAAVAILIVCASVRVWAKGKERLLLATVATDNTDGLRRLQESAEEFGLKLNVLGLGTEWNGGDVKTHAGGAQKIRMLREWLSELNQQEDGDVLVMFVDGYDVVINANAESIVGRLKEAYPDTRILFGAEAFCWPDAALATKYPLITFGERYLNSGMFIGYAPDVLKMLERAEVEGLKDDDDDQLFYTQLYLDETVRDELKMSLDSLTRIFLNLNGVAEHVKLEFDDEDGSALVYNTLYNTHPAVIHGNGASKLQLNWLGNYIAHEYHAKNGCRKCGAVRSDGDDGESLKLGNDERVGLAIFITKPVPYVEEFFAAMLDLDYPKGLVDVLVYNNQEYSEKEVELFLESPSASGYRSVKLMVEPNGPGSKEHVARSDAIEWALSAKTDYLFVVDADAHLERRVLRRLVKTAKAQNRDVIAPMLVQPRRLFSNFWGAVSPTGYYARADDYIEIVERRRLASWNVPFINSAILLSRGRLAHLTSAYTYNSRIDADMSFAQYCREHGHFMFANNQHEYGFLVESDEFARLSPERINRELYDYPNNLPLWEKRYIHPDYFKLLDPTDEVPLACPDVYDYPLVSERFAKEIIEVMEHYGGWSDGSNVDRRLEGGYENVPTRDIHMNQVGFERQWLGIMDAYVAPIQEKVFIGFFQRPIRANMMFVVRYRPEEQNALRPHHDASTYSIDMALNKKGVDYEGGGVRYIRYNCTVAADQVGWTMMFPGRLTHLHEGLPTTKGTRYILVSFINP